MAFKKNRHLNPKHLKPCDPHNRHAQTKKSQGGVSRLSSRQNNANYPNFNYIPLKQRSRASDVAKLKPQDCLDSIDHYESNPFGELRPHRTRGRPRAARVFGIALWTPRARAGHRVRYRLRPHRRTGAPPVPPAEGSQVPARGVTDSSSLASFN